MIKNTNYIKFNKEYKFDYTIIPNKLFTDSMYKNLSCEAKLLYSLMLNRTSLSVKNNWKDKLGNVYIIFTRKNAMDLLNFGRSKATKTFKELKSVDLIEDISQNNKKANIIYVKLPVNLEKSKKQSTKNCNPSKQQKLKRLNTSIKIKNQLLENLEKLISKKKQIAYEKNLKTICGFDIFYIKKQIEYDYFIKNLKLFKIDKQLLDIIVYSIAEMKLSKTTKINGCYYEKEYIQAVLKTLDSSTMVEFIKKLRTIDLENVKNLKGYLKSTLVNFVYQTWLEVSFIF